MAASSHGSPSSFTSAQAYHAFNVDDLDPGYDTSHNHDHSEHQDHFDIQTQTKTGKEQDDNTDDGKNLNGNTDIESPLQGKNYDTGISLTDNNNFGNKSDTVETSGRRLRSTSCPNNDSTIYTDKSTLHSTITTTQQQLSNVEPEGPRSSSTVSSINMSQQKWSNAMSSLVHRSNTSSPLCPSSKITSVPCSRPRSTSLVMNPAPLTLHLCNNHPNADDSCPTMGTKTHSDDKQLLPSDEFRNRQRKRQSYHPERIPSTSSIHKNQQSALKQEISNNLTQLKETSTDVYDWDFWAKTIHQFDQIKQQQPQNLRDHVCIGMPPSLRGMIWQVFSKSKHNNDVLELEYRELLNGVCQPMHEKIIQRDLARTFPTHTFFRQRDGDGQEMLFNVIKAYSIYDPQVGYCQGLPFIVGCLLLHMPDEAAFCVLVNLMNDYGLREHFTPKMELLHERLFQYEELLMKHLPQVQRHLDAQGICPTMYASQWFLTLFSARCPLNLAFRILDMVFTEGTSIILNVALALLKKNQAAILGLEFEGLLRFLSSDIFCAYQDIPSEFVKDAFTFHISPQDLAKLSKRYTIKAARDAKIQDMDNYLKIENYELTQQFKKLEKLFITLEQEHETIAKQVIESKMSMATTSDDNHKLQHGISQLEQQINEQQPYKRNGETDYCSYKEDEFSRFAQENAHLEQQNVHLEHRLIEIGTALDDFKLKYAERENEYVEMKKKLGQIRNSRS